MLRKIGFVLVAVVVFVGFVVTDSSASKLRLELRVVMAGETFDSTTNRAITGPGTSFYVGGDICADLTAGAACDPIGVFHCWGWMIGDDAGTVLVSQEYEIFDNAMARAAGIASGKLQLQGVEDGGPRAVTGGTGKYMNVRGEATGFDFGTAGEFTVKFKLKK